jgi:hypothetical protein
MSARGEVSLGDLVKAVALLRPRDHSTASAMAHLLDFDLGPVERERLFVTVADEEHTGPSRPPVPASAPYLSDAAPAPAPRAPRIAAVVHDPPPPPLAHPGRSDPAPRLADRPLDFTLARTRPPSDGGTGEPHTTPNDHGSPEPPDGPASGPHPTAPEPPWSPEWARGVMVAAVSAPVASRRLDQRALVRKVSRQQALRTVPWQRRPSTRRGVQLLLDHGAGMSPFQDDRRWLRALLESVAGRDRVEVLRFTGSPLRGVVRTAGGAAETYRPPAPGTPVVLVSDLGRIRPPFTGRATARLDEWVDFVDGVLHSGCPTVCMTPFPAHTYPRSVRGRVALIPFDRRISLRHAREATRAVHRLLEGRS